MLLAKNNIISGKTMEVFEEPTGIQSDSFREKYLDSERRLRTLELEKIDLVQSIRLSLKSIGLVLTRRGYNSDLVNVIKKTENSLGTELDSLAICDQLAERVSALSGHDATFVPIDECKEGLQDEDPIDANLKEALKALLGQLGEFKNHRYRNSTQIITQLLGQDSSLENLFPVVVDLCQRFLYDYSQEIKNITNRLNSIIRMLLFIEKEYSKFLDLSITNYSGNERDFKDDLVNSLGQLHKTVKENEFRVDAENLLNQLSLRIEGLLLAVQKKNDEDAKLLSALTQERELLMSRLDNVRRDYDNFVSQSHKTLIEMETIKSISLRDALTQVYNRRAYDEQIATTIENFEKGKLQTFSLIIFDIDFFREVNNNYGHLAGDSILTNVGRIVKESLRSDDFIFRYGGDEFIVLLPEAKLADAIKVAEKLRHQLEVVEFRLSRSSDISIHVSISLGVTEVLANDTVSSVFARADKALYVSKKEGRNKVSSL
jgi:diguanylate cyclase (GGDEF)-like protein